MTKPVALITGVGPGTGSALVRRFAADGYAVAMLARNAERLAALEAELPDARAYICDVADEAAVNATITKIRADMGKPEVLIHNAVGGGWGKFLDIKPEMLNRNFQINTMGLLYLAQALAPDMIEAGKGRPAHPQREHGPRPRPQGCACRLCADRCRHRCTLDTRGLPRAAR